jgi:hypothetical protein
MSTKGQEMARQGFQTAPGIVSCLTAFDDIAGYCFFTAMVSLRASGISAACKCQTLNDRILLSS